MKIAHHLWIFADFHKKLSLSKVSKKIVLDFWFLGKYITNRSTKGVMYENDEQKYWNPRSPIKQDAGLCKWSIQTNSRRETDDPANNRAHWAIGGSDKGDTLSCWQENNLKPNPEYLIKNFRRGAEVRPYTIFSIRLSDKIKWSDRQVAPAFYDNLFWVIKWTNITRKRCRWLRNRLGTGSKRHSRHNQRRTAFWCYFPRRWI